MLDELCGVECGHDDVVGSSPSGELFGLVPALAFVEGAEAEQVPDEGVGVFGVAASA